MADRELAELDRVEQALTRLRTGESQQTISDELDPELRPLFAVAARLQRELPRDLPDPVFRERVGRELLDRAGSPGSPERHSRRFFYDWRFAVAAGALVAIVLIAVIFGTNALEGNSPEPPARETVVSALSVSGKETARPGQTASPETVSDTKVLPPIDAAHVVVVPVSSGAATTSPATPAPQPTPGISVAAPLPELPQTAPTWLLTGPDSSQTFLQTLIARIGINGTIAAAPADGPNAFVVNDSTGFPTIHWDQNDAFFRYDRGPDEPTPPAARATTNPAVTAKDWLSEIGFDLTTITYSETVEANSDQTVVTFKPSNIPSTAIAPELGVEVGVGPGGSIQFAQGFWLTLGESAEVPLRTSQETIDAARGGEWYSATATSGSTELSLKVSSAKLTYLLTRADESSYLLQPVMELKGDRWTPKGVVQDSIFVSAIKKQ